VSYQWDAINGVWNMVGYRTGNKISIPDFGASLPDHMYFNLGEANAIDMFDESMGHVLYVYNTRVDYEARVPNQWHNINEWNTTGVSFPVIPL
jgi:hypothetical protein